MTATSSTLTNCSVPTSLSPTTVQNSDMSAAPTEAPGPVGSLDVKPDPEKIPLPNNIRKKKEAALSMEIKEDDSDTASDQQNGNAAAAQPCAICKMSLDNFNQSRALTKSNCTMFGIKENDLVNGMRVCASCRFKSVRKRCFRCPLPNCKTPKRKVKRLRPLPIKLAEMSKESRDTLLSELEIPSEAVKCCSACFNRITRKIENNSGVDLDMEDIKWADYELDLIKQGLGQHGTDWTSVASVVATKSKEQCRHYFFTYKHKLGLDEIVHEYKKSKRSQEDGKPPPIVTDEEESGETTSSCDEDDRVDRCSSDTASAPSPVNKILDEDKNINQVAQEIPTEVKSEFLDPDMSRSQNLAQLDASPKCPPDYDSSATVSADEGQNDGRDSSPRIVHQSNNHSSIKMPLRVEPSRKPLPLQNSPDSSVPLVKTLLQDPKIGAAITDDSPSYIQPSKSVRPEKSEREPTCVRDLIYQAIEMSLGSQWPTKSGRKTSPVPSSSDVTVVIEPKKESDGSGLIPPAHGGSRLPSRPSSHHMEVQPDCEVQDLSKKIKSRDVSPVKDFLKRERVVTPVRPPSGSNIPGSHGPYYATPPPAHSNQFRTAQPQPPPPALSPHFVTESHHEPYFPRGADPRGKAFIAAERPHSQPPHLVAQSSSLSREASIPPHAKPVAIKATVPPPPPLVASKPSQMSPKLQFKERLVSVPPSGSITQGTPVNQQSVSVPPTNLSSARYEGYIRQLPQTKDGGSITLGTPVQHESVKRVPSNRPEAFPPNMTDGIVRQAVPAMYDPGVMDYYRQVTPGGQQYPFAPGYPAYPTGINPHRPPYANESQLSTKQIMIDFNTSKQMQMRRGGSGPPEKEMKASPRGSDSNPQTSAPQENHLHPMYPPTNYQGSGGPHYNHVPSGFQSTDSRYIHHRSPNTQIDRTRSPSGVESPLNAGYATHPGKRSPSLALASGRQNVIHRSITWGTGKPSVIQAPQSASPRTPDLRTETVSPASVRKSTPSPRQPQPMIYPPSGHDAFNTLVNAAVAQPSLVVPKDDKGLSPSNTRPEVKSPRDRPVVEGLEKTMIDMHQRPRSYTESGHAPERVRNTDGSPPEQLNESHRYPMHGSYDVTREQRLSDKQQMIMGEQPSSLRLGNMREPFSREQFERQMRQPNVSSGRDRPYPKKEEERCRSGSSENQSSNFSSSHQSDLDNEASKIFSQSFQKDVPRSDTSTRGFTAANLIDAIITRQINQHPDPVTNKSSVDLFGQYHSTYGESKTSPKTNNNKVNTRTEVVTIDDEPETDKGPGWSERSTTHGRSPPVTVSNAIPGAGIQYSGEKGYTLHDHIAEVISKDYNNPSDTNQIPYNSTQPPGNTAVASSRPPYAVGSSNSAGKSLEGIASALPPEAVLVNSNAHHGAPDHSQQNCPGNGCVYHTHSWKLRRALQQDRDREHRSPGLNETSLKRPASNQSSDVPVEERQIIRVAQTSSPALSVSSRTTPTGPYGVEPISPPSQSNEDNASRNSTNTQPPSWANNPNITNILTQRHMYPAEYSDVIPPVYHPGAPGGSSNPAPNRPPHQQQMGLSPLDYVKNRIVEVMRTATDTEPEMCESRRPQSAMSYSEERDHQLQQHVYRFQPDRDSSAERPNSNGNGPPLLQGQRYSPAVARYSPVPPRPSSAVERVPSRNSTPGEIPRQHKRGSEGHIVGGGEWREGQSVSSRASSRSVSPSNADHPEGMSRKKTRSEGTFIPESTTDRAPVLLPQNSINIHRSGSMSEAPRLSSNNPGVLENQGASKSLVSPRNDSYLVSQVESDGYKFRVSDNRPENQWGPMVNNHRTSENEPLARLGEPMSIGTASSTTVESFSPSNRTDIVHKSLDRSDSGPRQSPVTSSGSQEPNRNSPAMSSQGPRTALGMNVSSSSGMYSSYGPAAANSGVTSSSTNNSMFSSSSSLPPHTASPHVAAYSSFSGMGNTYAYPFSALSMRSMPVPPTTHDRPLLNSSSSVSSSHAPPVNSSRNSPSPLHRSQPAPLLSSQYEPLSDED